jgi:hypothetical protein
MQHPDIQSAIYYGAKPEAGRIGYWAGMEVKPIHVHVEQQDLVVVGDSGDVGALVKEIRGRLRYGFLKNEYEHSVKLFVHEGVYDQVAEEVKGLVEDMFSGETDFSFDTKKYLLLSNLERFMKREELQDANPELLTILEQFTKHKGEITDPFGFHLDSSTDLFHAQYELQTSDNPGK